MALTPDQIPHYAIRLQQTGLRRFVVTPSPGNRKSGWREIPPRPLTKDQGELLEFLLSEPFPGRDELQSQLATARVTAECSCGCRSSALDVDRSASPPVRSIERIPVEAEGADVDGTEVDLLLHVVGGYMNELEIFRVDSKPIVRVPRPGKLQLFRCGVED